MKISIRIITNEEQAAIEALADMGQKEIKACFTMLPAFKRKYDEKLARRIIQNVLSDNQKIVFDLILDKRKKDPTWLPPGW